MKDIMLFDGGIGQELVKRNLSTKDPLWSARVLLDNFELVKNLDEFKKRSDIIIANRVTEEILDCKEKLFSRDLSYDTKSRPKNI